MKLRIVFLLVAIILGGCASNQQFDCPYVGGVRCQSMSEIDKLVDREKLGTTNPVSTRKYVTLHRARFYLPTNKRQRLPIRSSDEVVQIWIGAYESVDGIYHHPTMLNIVLKPGKWH